MKQQLIPLGVLLLLALFAMASSPDLDEDCIVVGYHEPLIGECLEFIGLRNRDVTGLWTRFFDGVSGSSLVLLHVCSDTIGDFGPHAVCPDGSSLGGFNGWAHDGRDYSLSSGAVNSASMSFVVDGDPYPDPTTPGRWLTPARIVFFTESPIGGGVRFQIRHNGTVGFGVPFNDTPGVDFAGASGDYDSFPSTVHIKGPRGFLLLEGEDDACIGLGNSSRPYNQKKFMVCWQGGALDFGQNLDSQKGLTSTDALLSLVPATGQVLINGEDLGARLQAIEDRLDALESTPQAAGNRGSAPSRGLKPPRP